MVMHIPPFRANNSHPMLSIIRFILIVGAIFYYSPVRQQGEGTAAIEAIFTPKKSEPAVAPPSYAQDNPGHLETVWKALPDSACEPGQTFRHPALGRPRTARVQAAQLEKIAV
jgi:hypothetical protein